MFWWREFGDLMGARKLLSLYPFAIDFTTKLHVVEHARYSEQCPTYTPLQAILKCHPPLDLLNQRSPLPSRSTLLMLRPQLMAFSLRMSPNSVEGLGQPM